ncbi:MAG TPA: glutamine--fructose-6-phosphate transaminase (isomerizing) [Firmicutes bacterium]|nr:glutamine--fructose-6-phosphate transaminase (isomerizing) [Bacillota bacterium]
MCGIVGYVGTREAVPILMESLGKLEYRGYDSAGIAVIGGDRIVVRKTQGRLDRLAGLLDGGAPSGTIGIGHTRWATHGKPSDINAHPHLDCKGDLAVVHNGIIENYLNLREELETRGHRFTSETDTETLPHLIEDNYNYNGDLEEAVRRSLEEARGSYAIAVLSRREPDKLVVARKNSPLIIGIGDGESFVASDIPAVLGFTKKVLILDDDEFAVITRDGVRVFTIDRKPVSKELLDVTWDPVLAEKGGYEHFMLKEIHEQPRAVRDTLSERISADGQDIVLNELGISREEINGIRKVFMVACGTAYHACLVGRQVVRKLARIPVEAELASEFRYSDPMVGEHDLTVVVSQSGETADTLAALREAKAKGSRVVAITNVMASSVAREAHDVIYTWAGPEIAVASTKAYISQLVCMYLLGIFLGRKRGIMPDDVTSSLVRDLKQLPLHIDTLFGRHEEDVKALAEKFKKCEDIFFIGRGLDYAVAMEGSLKLKEVSYIRAEAYAAGELKHGTLALIVEGVPVFALATQMDVYEKMVSNIKEVKARGAMVIALAYDDNEDIHRVADYVIRIPRTNDLLSPVLSVVPLQLFAYYAARARGCDVDKPRNLAKSVTVE